MTIATIDDLFATYSDRCGSSGPEYSRDQLRADYQAWCRANNRSGRYEVSGEEYLRAVDGAEAEAEADFDRRCDEALDERAAAEMDALNSEIAKDLGVA